MTRQDEHWKIVRRFAQVAERFCSLVDSLGTLERTEFLLRIYRLLPELINEAVRLPLIESEDDGDDDSEDPPDYFSGTIMNKMPAQAGRRLEEERRPRYEALKEKLGNWNLYWEVFNPTDDADHEPIYGSLADDITDIYHNLKDGFLLMENPQTTAEDVIFQWRYNYYIHWGHHAIDAVRTLHVRLQDTLTGDEEN